jgi:hypothetical protein
MAWRRASQRRDVELMMLASKLPKIRRTRATRTKPRTPTSSNSTDTYQSRMHHTFSDTSSGKSQSQSTSWSKKSEPLEVPLYKKSLIEHESNFGNWKYSHGLGNLSVNAELPVEQSEQLLYEVLGGQLDTEHMMELLRNTSLGGSASAFKASLEKKHDSSPNIQSSSKWTATLLEFALKNGLFEFSPFKLGYEGMFNAKSGNLSGGMNVKSEWDPFTRWSPKTEFGANMGYQVSPTGSTVRLTSMNSGFPELTYEESAHDKLAREYYRELRGLSTKSLPAEVLDQVRRRLESPDVQALLLDSDNLAAARVPEMVLEQVLLDHADALAAHKLARDRGETPSDLPPHQEELRNIVEPPARKSSERQGGSTQEQGRRNQRQRKRRTRSNRPPPEQQTKNESKGGKLMILPDKRRRRRRNDDPHMMLRVLRPYIDDDSDDEDEDEERESPALSQLPTGLLGQDELASLGLHIKSVLGEE